MQWQPEVSESGTLYEHYLDNKADYIAMFDKFYKISSIFETTFWTSPATSKYFSKFTIIHL